MSIVSHAQQCPASVFSQLRLHGAKPRNYYCIFVWQRCYRVINYLWLEGRRARGKQNNRLELLSTSLVSLSLWSRTAYLFCIPLFLNFRLYSISHRKIIITVINITNRARYHPTHCLSFNQQLNTMYTAFSNWISSLRLFVFLFPHFLFCFLKTSNWYSVNMAIGIERNSSVF